jgi:glucan 1,3-beta-glucosidase
MINDLVFYGGLKAASLGNQQFTMRNITFNNAVTAIDQLWDWGWTYKSLNINNCALGINITSGGPTAQSVGSITLFDSSISNTPVGISTVHSTTQTTTDGTMILENVSLNNVPVAVQGPSSSTILAGSAGSTNIAGWGQGHSYTPSGPTNIQGSITPFSRPASLLSSGAYYERSKPQYEAYSYLSFKSTRAAGAKGDGVTDDTVALQSVINSAAANGQIVFFDAGTYKITNTLNIPKGSKLVGESYPVIMSSGAAFADVTNPKAVVSVGTPGDQGQVEWSDMIISTQGAQPGAILIEWNLSSAPTSPSGMWDVHTRVRFPYSDGPRCCIDEKL